MKQNQQQKQILLEEGDYLQMKQQVSDIHQHVIAGNPLQHKSLPEVWFDIQQACQELKISKRTLQSYRDNGILPFSKIAGKIYFRASDIQKHLEDHYTPARKTR